MNTPRDASSQSVLRVDETYVKVDGKWAYLYRAVDSAGETIEFLLSPNRDLVAAKSSYASHCPARHPGRA